MSIWKLRLAMILTALGVFAAGSLVLYGVMKLLEYYGFLAFTPRLFIIADAVLCMFLALFQWLFAPYFIELFYNCVEADPRRYPHLYEIVKELAVKSGLKTIPKVMIANIPIPNAFAYGSPLTGPRVAVTRPLLEILDEDELRAVLGHEIGHLKHRDVTWMLAIGLIPMIVWSIGETLLRLGFWTSILAPLGDREDVTPVVWIVIGAILLALAFMLNIFVLAFSRYREYYADRHSVALNPNGGIYLQRALAKIVASVRPSLLEESEDMLSLLQFKALFIQDPLASSLPRRVRSIDELIERLKRRKLTLWDHLKELLSTHPDITKRLRMLDKFNEEFWGSSSARYYYIPVT